MNVASQLAAVVEAGRADTAERRRLAEAATPGPWVSRRGPGEHVYSESGYYVADTATRVDRRHIAANDPATVLQLCDQEDRHYAAAEDIIHSHAEISYPDTDSRCAWDGELWPCSVYNIEAARWGIS